MVDQRHEDRGIEARSNNWVFAGRAISLFERHPVVVGLVVLVIPSVVSAVVSLLLSLGFVPGKTPNARLNDIAIASAVGDTVLHRRIDSLAALYRLSDSVALDRWEMDRPIMRATAIDLCIRLTDEVLAFTELRCERRFRRGQ